MRIPVGNGLGQVAPDTTPHAAADSTPGQLIGRSVQNLGAAGADYGLATQRQDEAMARAQAANAAADRELLITQHATDVQNQVQSGDLKYQDAKQQFSERLSKIEPPAIDHLPADDQLRLNHAYQMLDAKAGMQMDEFVKSRREDDFKGQFAQFLDTQGKIAGQPGVNIDQINASVDQAGREMAKQAGLSSPATEKALQDFKDRNWFNNVNEKVMQSRNNIDALRAIENDLASADGAYAKKLDTDKRDALLNRAMNYRLQLENKALMQSDRRDAKAQRALNEYDQQISTGVPAPAATLANWADTTKGTSFEADFRQRLNDEKQVQEVLRLPIEQQSAFVQQKQAEIMQNGGDVRQIANLNRLQGAVDKNIKQLQEQPLLYAQNRTGEVVQPLDLQQLFQPGGGDQLVGQLKDRMDTISALRQQYGGRVQMRPLLDGEAATLSNMFSTLGVQQKEDALRTLHEAVGSAGMVPMMQQVAKNDPVLAIASGLTAAQTTEGRSVARLALQGDELLKKKQVVIPSDAKLNQAFQDYIGNAITTIPGKQAAMQATNAIYAQLSAEQGRFLTKDSSFDASLYDRSIRLATGGIVDYNGAKVLPIRYGASPADTKQTLKSVSPALVKAWGGVHGMTDEQAADFIKSAPLESVGFGRYRVKAGAGLLPSPHGGAFEMVFN